MYLTFFHSDHFTRSGTLKDQSMQIDSMRLDSRPDLMLLAIRSLTPFVASGSPTFVVHTGFVSFLARYSTVTMDDRLT